MGNPRPLQRFSVQLCRLDIEVRGRVSVRDDREGCAFMPSGVQANDCLAEKWASQNIDAVSGADGVKPKGAENVPGRHLAHVVVTANPIDFCMIGLFENTTNPFLRKPWPTGIHEQ